MTCFGEVKSYCTKKEFTHSIHNLIKAKALLCEPQARVTSFMFCYDAYASTKSFFQWVDHAIGKLENRARFAVWHYPDYVFCLKKNIMLEKRTVPEGLHYFNVTATSSKSNLIQQKIIQDLIQCVTDGCARV